MQCKGRHRSYERVLGTWSVIAPYFSDDTSQIEEHWDFFQKIGINRHRVSQ